MLAVVVTNVVGAGLGAAGLVVLFAALGVLGLIERHDREHWTVTASERARPVWAHSHPLIGLLGYADDGELYVPLGKLRGEPWWLDRFNPKNPWHWLPWLRSRLTRRVAWIECR